ncbi:MAG: hypothetical protein JWQ81_6613 [Amycolatopsis sp.]|jgi:hypothetical protein|uniref:DnaJ family domain-containing protein n=1 Tax=Amycolatopsis sp. TaxID=37632 RepID=UPI0026357A4A|nr:DUF1992 domain-containing protein [Amycolatopsis sp.]MCU1685874.1 hypothetical protein [Amycolatopsis sp.]
MTERKPSGVNFESWVDKQIREAEARGDFDNLPGTGKPLPDAGGPHDENWWIKRKLASEGLSADALLPTSLRLRKEIQRLPDTVSRLTSERAVREVVEKLNQEIVAWMRAPSGPSIPVRPVVVGEVVERWHADRLHAKEIPPSAPRIVKPVPKRTSWWRRKSHRREEPP